MARSTFGFADAMSKQLDRDRRQVRFAMAVALTRTASAVKRAEEDELARELDRPTLYTMRALYMAKATPDNLQATVWLKDDRATSNAGTPATAYLAPQIEGTSGRNVKRFERALQYAGVMPTGWHAVPGHGARLDAFGNISRGQINQILSQLAVEQVRGFNRSTPRGKDRKTQSKRRRAFGRAGGQYVAFKAQTGKLSPGVYLAEAQDFGAKLGLGRSGRLVMVLAFRQGTRYRRRIDWDGVADRVVDERLEAEFERALNEALGSAQPRQQMGLF